MREERGKVVVFSSDFHGKASALRAFLEDALKLKRADYVVLGGDLGPRGGSFKGFRLEKVEQGSDEELCYQQRSLENQKRWFERIFVPLILNIFLRVLPQPRKRPTRPRPTKKKNVQTIRNFWQLRLGLPRNIASRKN